MAERGNYSYYQLSEQDEGSMLDDCVRLAGLSVVVLLCGQIAKTYRSLTGSTTVRLTSIYYRVT
jgi:hypothetical protein